MNRRQHPRHLETLEHRDLLATDLFADVFTKPDSSLFPKELAPFGDSLILRADNGFEGPEAWLTNGVDPPEILRDIRPGQLGASPRGFVEFEGDLYFTANNGITGFELWRSDGTSSGTELVIDLWLGAEGGVPSDMHVMGDTLYFFGHNGDNGRELFKTDGTELGTVMVKDGIEGRRSVSGERMIVVEDQLFYLGQTADSADALRLWVSDGSESGTQSLEIDELQWNDSEQVWMTAVGDQLAIGSDRIGVWLTDGTVEATRQIASPGQLNGLATSGQNLYLSSNRGLEVFDADLTSSTSVATVSEGVVASAGKTYYWDPGGVYVIDGVDSTLTRLVGFVTFFGSSMGAAVPIDGGLIFNVNKALDDYEIWSTDGTLAGTQLLDTVSDTNLVALEGFLQVGSNIYFAATNGQTSTSVWSVPAPVYEVPEEAQSIEGDLNNDQIVDLADVDALFAAVASGSSDERFDLDDDQRITSGDGEYLLQNILQTRSGDLDLDGNVGFADFLVLSANFGASDAGWADGDLTGDGDIGFADFLLLSANFGFARATP